MTLLPLWNAGFCFAIFFSAVVLLALAIKAWEVWRTRKWLPVPGVVVNARTVQRKVGRAQNTGDKRIGNFAEITFEYRLDGRVLRGTRVNVTPPVADTMVEQTLQRYPIGTPVTVYYDPAAPTESVLEREWPRGLFLASLGLIFFLFVVGYLIPWAMTSGEEALAKLLRQPSRAGLAVALAVVALFIRMIGLALRREQHAAKGWPSVRGTIETSRFEIDSRRSATGVLRWKRFRPLIVYSYQVGEQTYRGDRLAFGGRSAGAVRRLDRGPSGALQFRLAPPRRLERLLQQYPEGAQVSVYYDPKAPAESVLDPVKQSGIAPAFLISYAFALGSIAVILSAL